MEGVTWSQSLSTSPFILLPTIELSPKKKLLLSLQNHPRKQPEQSRLTNCTTSWSPQALCLYPSLLSFASWPCSHISLSVLALHLTLSCLLLWVCFEYVSVCANNLPKQIYPHTDTHTHAYLHGGSSCASVSKSLWQAWCHLTTILLLCAKFGLIKVTWHS